MSAEGLRVGMKVLSPRYGHGVIVDTDYAFTTRRWIHKIKVIVQWNDVPVTQGYKGNPNAGAKIQNMYERRTVERYRNNYRRLRRGGIDGSDHSLQV